MSANDFQFICGEVGILPQVALEDDFVRTILKEDKGKCSVTNQIKLSTYLHDNF
jgi:hypothetical protein